MGTHWKWKRSWRGQTTAIIGSTGAGKTTLLSLVPRLFDATGGRVLVDGIDVRDIEPEALWERIGLVPQRPYLFSGTVAINLRYGNPDATDEELWEALEIAQGKDFVEAMAEGLDAPIAQGGTNVSGGQRQRLAIARALVASRRSTCSTTRSRRSTWPPTPGCGRRCARSRPTPPWWSSRSGCRTISDADQIVVLEDGAIVGNGTHDELLETCPTYLEIVESQLTAEEAA